MKKEETPDHASLGFAQEPSQLLYGRSRDVLQLGMLN